MSMVKLIEPTVEPITAEQAWRHLRVAVGDPVETPDDADDIADKLSEARELVERYTGRSLVPQTLMLILDAFPTGDDLEIELKRPPVASIVSVVYVDEDGNEQTMSDSDYSLDSYSEPAYLFPADGTTWPATKAVVNAVRITFEAGYSAPGDSPLERPCPRMLRAALKLILAHLYENREDTAPVKLEEIPTGAKNLMRHYRLENGFA